MQNKRSKKDVDYKEDDAESDFICKICKKQFQRESSLNKHIDRVHKKIKNHQCQHCAYSAYETRDLNRHCMKNHGVYTTEICNSTNIESQDNLSLYDSVSYFLFNVF